MSSSFENLENEMDALPHFASLIDNATTEELKLGLLRAIDHARKSSAEIAAYKALLDDARTQIHELSNENRELSSRLELLSRNTK